MRCLLIALLLSPSVGFPNAGKMTIRQIDFKNFSYPSPHSFTWSSKLEWLDMSKQKHVRLVNGRELPDSGNGLAFTGLTLEEVQFADLTGEGRTNAIVVLRYDIGGTQYSHYVYIYSLAGEKPKLLTCFHSGDRAHSGLYRVYEQKGKLVV